MLDLKQCRYVLTIAECRSFSKAAELLYLAQPSLSRAVKNLEDELGTCIFNRRKVPLELTPSGECLIRYINRFQKLEFEMRQELTALSHHAVQRLRIGSLSFLASYLLPLIIPQFVEAFPQVSVDIREYRSNQINHSLLFAEVDLFITNLPPVHSELDYCKIAQDRVLLITRRTSALEQEFDLRQNCVEHPYALDLKSLKNATFVLLRPWQNMHTIARSIFTAHNFSPNRIVEAPSITSALSLTSRPSHLTFVCESALHYAKPEMPLAYFSVKGGDSMASILVTYCKKNSNELIPEFCRLARRIFHS